MPDMNRKPYTSRTRDTVIAMLTRPVSRSGDKAFYYIDSAASTIDEVDQRSTSFANAQTALGMVKGDTVLTIMEASDELFAQCDVGGPCCRDDCGDSYTVS